MAGLAGAHHTATTGPENAQRFRLDTGLSERYDIGDISALTLPLDFARNPRIHRCYEVRPRANRARS